MPPNQTETMADHSGAVLRNLKSVQTMNGVEKPQVDLLQIDDKKERTGKQEETYEQQKILWPSVMIFAILHSVTLYALALTIHKMKFLTMIWALFMGATAIFGVTGGVHRLWSHKTYKAKVPLRIILAICYSVAAQYSPWDWVRDHRVHHKFSDTDADPHNAKRGLFYSHIGWLMQSKHPDMVRQEKQIDMSDILQDKVFMMLTKYYPYFGMFFGFMVPIFVPILCWNESLECAIAAQLTRYILSLNFTFSINSLAHAFGQKPYKKNIRPTEGLITSIITLGEGWHNYHHTFPWDYRAGELGPFKFNFTTTLLNNFAKIGWAYDMKAATPNMIQQVAKKHGDGSRIPEVPHPDESPLE